MKFRKFLFKFIQVSILALLVACGNGGGSNPGGGGGGGGSDEPYVYVDNGLHYDESQIPVTFYVNRQKYNTYRASFDRTEGEFKSKSGKQLVKFVPRDENPKFSKINDSSSLWDNQRERWVMFRESDSEFTDLDGAAGVALYSWNANKELVYGQIVIDETTVTRGYYFQQVIIHEVGHTLGFEHTFKKDYSIMNYNYAYKTDGLTYLDIQRTADKYPFSMVSTYIKDLEKIAAIKEDQHKRNYQEYIIEAYGLSEKRAVEVSKVVFSYNKVKAKRSLTAKDKNIMTEKLLGFGYETGKKALAQLIAGEDSDEVEDLFQKAADKNNIDPEHVKELISEVFLK